MSEMKKQQTEMQSIRTEALETFQEMKMPSLRYGLGIYVDLAALNLEDVLKENTEDFLKVEADLRVKVLNLKIADKSFLDKYFSKLIKPNENKFTALHYAAFNDAVAIIIPKDSVIHKPIMIKSNLKSKSKCEHIIVIAEENSKATIVEVSESGEDSYFKSQAVQVYAEENSELTYFSLQNLSNNTYNFSIKRGEAKQNAKIKWLDMAFGGKFSQLQMRTHLIAPGASAKKFGAFFGNESQQFDLNIESVHETHHTESSMSHRGILNENAKSIFRGTVKIVKNAYGSIGHQKSDVLLLGENAKCDAVPILEVENDEVVCSHGVTMGQVDPEQLFYLISRGLSDEDAKKMIISGFLEPISSEINNDEIREKIAGIVNKKLTLKGEVLENASY